MKKIVTFVCILGIAVAGSVTAIRMQPYLAAYHRAKEVQAEMQTVKETVKTSKGMDFKRLEKINPDVVAWLEIPHTAINYPVVQTRDNDYYLMHDIHREFSRYGTLFFDQSLYEHVFASYHLIIYGHNMGVHTDLMFSSLEKLYSGGAAGDYHTLYLYTAEQTYQYEFLELRQVAPDAAIFTTTFSSRKVFTRWKKKNGIVAEPEMPQILSLVTCNGDGSRRNVVIFRRER